MRLRITCGRDLKLRDGESLAVDGVCLTCEKVSGRKVQFVLSSETLERSRLGSSSVGDRVNLERALAADGRLGGHFVQGHVDGVGTVTSLEEDPPGWTLSVELPAKLTPYCVEKGSIGINGVSLTIARIAGCRIWIALVPFTWTHTALRYLRPQDPVNVENDILSKYVWNFMHPAEEGRAAEEFLWKFVREQS